MAQQAHQLKCNVLWSLFLFQEPLHTSLCSVSTATGLELQGSRQHEGYNGKYSRGAHVLNVHRQPSFWQNIGSPPSCQTALRLGDCFALSWIRIEVGANSSQSCLDACEAMRSNGCCRLGIAQSASSLPWRFSTHSLAPEGCSMGYGRRYGVEHQGPITASTPEFTLCTGQAFIFWCAPAKAWNLAPPTAWDAVQSEQCYDVAKKSFAHTVAFGPIDGKLTDGFDTEWGWKNMFGQYIPANMPISLQCPNSGSDTTTLTSTAVVALTGDTTTLMGDTTTLLASKENPSDILVPILSGACILLACIVLLCVALWIKRNYCQPQSSGPNVPAQVDGTVLDESTSNRNQTTGGVVVVGRPVGRTGSSGCDGTC